MLVNIRNKEEEMELLRMQIRNCYKCQMVNFERIFPGKYVEDMKYFFVGAAPFNKAGEEEAFRYGRASENFAEFLDHAGIDRKNCFTTNSVMHVPIDKNGNSRAQNDVEIINCNNWLEEQIQIMKPNLVIALGSVALTALNIIFPHKLSVRAHSGKGFLWSKGIWLFVLPHPSPNSFMVRSKHLQLEDYVKLKEFQEKINSKK